MPFSDNPINSEFMKRQVCDLTKKIVKALKTREPSQVLKSFDYWSRERFIQSLAQAGIITRIGKPSDSSDNTVHFWENDASRQLPALSRRLVLASTHAEYARLEKLYLETEKKAWAPEAEL